MRVALSSHVEDAEAIVIKAGQLPLEHGRTLFASANTHRRLAVEDGELAAYTDTRTPDAPQGEGKWTNTHTPTVT